MAEIYRALLSCVFRSLPDSAPGRAAAPDGFQKYGPLADSGQCPDATTECWKLTVRMLSGKEAQIRLSSKAAVSELAGSIEQALQVPASRQELVLPSGAILLTPRDRQDESKTLAEAGLADGDSIVVVHFSWLPPTLPSKFSLTVTSVRERIRHLVFPHYSSAFLICYEIEVDVPAGRVDVKLWRKNDHDTRTYDFIAGTVGGSHQHWMTGSTPFTQKLQDTGSASLEELLQRWLQKPTPVVSGERFWQKPDPDQESDVSEAWSFRLAAGKGMAEENPWPTRRPKWFELPEVGDFVELLVDLPFFTGRRLGRVLVDASGMPVRAALVEGQATCLHDAVEEFDVKWQEG